MKLTKEDTIALKGIAVLLLLCHHLFFDNTSLFDDIQIVGDYYLANTIGYAAKVCVAIFVFLSGYGLRMKYASVVKIEIKRFYIERITKLMAHYWFTWLVFMPISLLWLGPSLNDAYGNLMPLKFVMDFLGIINMIGWYGYNPTWWFYSCIIGLYLLYPLLHLKINTERSLIILASIALFFLPGGFLQPVRLYLLTFVFGMICADDKKEEIAPPKFLYVIIWLVVLLLLFSERAFTHNVMLGMFLDSFLSIAIIKTYSMIDLPQWVLSIFRFLGRHSMNIFLFHTFIFYLWFQPFFYYSRNPVIIYITLLPICLVISIFLNQLKELIRLETIISRITNRLCLITSA